MALDPMNRNITMKNVAGFHSLDRWTIAGEGFDFDCRRNLGTINCQKDGCAIRGNDSADECFKARAT